MQNSIVADNYKGSGNSTEDDIQGNTANAVVSTSSFNLIGTGGSGGLTNGTNNNQVGVANPGLGPLAIYGGFTQTHALQPGSPAIDKGHAFTLTTDQRGVLRPFENPLVPNASGGDGSDIGAFELNSVQPLADLAITKTASANPATIGGALTYTLNFNNEGPSTATNVSVTDTLPASVTFNSASASQGTCTESGGTVTCDLGSLANGARQRDHHVAPSQAISATRERVGDEAIQARNNNSTVTTRSTR